MSLPTVYNDFNYLVRLPVRDETFDYGDEELNEIHERLYYASRLFMFYDNLLLLTKTVKERKFLKLFIKTIFQILASQGAKAAIREAKELVKEPELVTGLETSSNSGLGSGLELNSGTGSGSGFGKRFKQELKYAFS